MIKDWDETQRATVRRALRFENPLVLDYWRTEVALNCAVSLGRLARICQERGADYDKTVKGLADV